MQDISKVIETIQEICVVQPEDVEALDKRLDNHFSNDFLVDSGAVSTSLREFKTCLLAWQDQNEGFWECAARATVNASSEQAKMGSTVNFQNTLLVVLLKCMLDTEGQEDSSNNASTLPSSFAMEAVQLYFISVRTRGAIAYGIFHATLMHQALACLRKWFRFQAAHVASNSGKEGSSKSRKETAPRKRRRAPKDEGESDEEENEESTQNDGEDDHTGMEAMGKRKNRSARSPKIAKGDRDSSGVLLALSQLQTLLASTPLPLATNRNMVVELAEMLAGAVAVASSGDNSMRSLLEAAIEGLAALAVPASAGERADVSLSADGTAAAALQALMPLLLMQGGGGAGSDVPVNAKDRVRAHDGALSAVLRIQKALSADAAKAGSRRLSASSVQSVDDAEAPAVPFAPLVALVQHLFVRAPDRAELRQRVASAIIELIRALDCGQDKGRCLALIRRATRSAKPANRGFAVEVAVKLLQEPWLWAREGARALLDAVVSRCDDKAPAVRSKAAVAVALLLDLVSTNKCVEGLRDAIIATAGWTNTGCGTGSKLLEVLRSRCYDDKATVRRNAIQALEVLLMLSPSLAAGAAPGSAHMLSADIRLLAGRCNDVSVACRKAALSAISNLTLKAPAQPLLQDAWVTALLPLANDPEQSCQAKLAESVMALICDKVLAWYNTVKTGGAGSDESTAESAATAADNMAVWVLLGRMAVGDYQRCLMKSVSLLLHGKEGKDMNFKPAPLLQALRAAALISLPVLSEEEEAHLTQDSTDAPFQLDNVLQKAKENVPVTELSTVRHGCWLLMESVLCGTGGPGASETRQPTTSTTIDPSFVVLCWDRLKGRLLGNHTAAGGDCVATNGERERENAALEIDGRPVLRVLGKLAPRVPTESAVRLAAELETMLLSLKPLPDTSAAITWALGELTCAIEKCPPSGASAACRGWTAKALTACENVLETYLKEGVTALAAHPACIARTADQSPGSCAASLLERALFLCGESALVGFLSEENINAGGKGNGSQPSNQLVELVLVLLPPFLPQGEGAGGAPNAVPPAVRALAFVTLGKLCLRDAALAKRTVNLLVREMVHENASAAVRSNALVVLGDLCVRYTSLVERHVPAMATCLQAPHPIVRRHALLLLSRLLLQDYLKWRGLLLFRFLACLVDKDPQVAQLAKSTLTHSLLGKQPTLFVQNIVEALIVLNGYAEHPMYKMAAASGDVPVSNTDKNSPDAGNNGVTMDGISLTTDERHIIYNTLLQHMTDEQKIATAAKFAHEILGGAIDGTLPVVAPGKGLINNSKAANKYDRNDGAPIVVVSEASRLRAESVCRDALTILAGTGLRVGKGGAGANAGDDDDDNEPAAVSQSAGMASAKSKLLSTLSRKHLIEHVVPVVVSLKHVLEVGRSPLLRELMVYLRELFRAFKDEVKETLASNSTLAAEIEFDLKQFEAEEQARKKKDQEIAAALAATLSAAQHVTVKPLGAKSPLPMVPPGTPLLAATGNQKRRASWSGADTRRVSFSTPHEAIGGLRAFVSPAMALTNGKGASSIRASTPKLKKSPGAGLSRTPAEAVAALLKTRHSTGHTCVTSTKFNPNAIGGSSFDNGVKHNIVVPSPKAVPAWNVTVPQLSTVNSTSRTTEKNDSLEERDEDTRDSDTENETSDTKGRKKVKTRNNSVVKEAAWVKSGKRKNDKTDEVVSAKGKLARGGTSNSTKSRGKKDA